MLVFALHPSARLTYILNHILTERLGIPFKITDNPDYFRKSPSLKINYSNEIIEGCLNVPSALLLYEENIRIQEIEVSKNEKWTYTFFELPYQHIPDVKVNTHYLPFDFFAASFYLLSRYEEYLPGKRDEHNRFKPKESLAFKSGFLDIPLLDYWLIEFTKKLSKQYPELTFKQNNFKQINTVDIDFAYKYKGLSLFRLAKKFAGSLLAGKPDVNCLVQPELDPYDTYEFLTAENPDEKSELIFFFLLADYGGHDKNLSPESKEIIQLFQQLSKKYTCGIHPSYQSAVKKRLLQKEIQIYQKLNGSIPEVSKNHFLKIKLPETYHQLVQAGIKQDYSMAYSTQTGFRASTSFPFYLFDLHQNLALEILVYSPCVMDVTLKNSLELEPEAAIKKIGELKKTVQEVQGNFISIWHNSNFDPSLGWTGWREVYQSLFK